MEMDIQFINTKEWGINKAGFDTSSKRLQDHVADTEGVLNVVFVKDDYIQKLNKQYRKKDQPTDVLSFSYIETSDFKDTGLIGEVYISIPTAKKQAKKELEHELNKLFVHGFLHVFGHNHESEKDFKKMNKIEREILG